MPDAFECSAQDIVLSVVPISHVNTWRLSYSVPLAGAKLVFPGPKLDGVSLFELLEQEKVMFSAGVPTAWLGPLQHMQANKLKLSTFCRVVIDDSAVLPTMIRTPNGLDAEAIHTRDTIEMSPLGTTCKLMGKHADSSDGAKQYMLERQGYVVCGVEMRIIDAEGHEPP